MKPKKTLMKLLNDYPEQLYLGINPDDERVYLMRPSWDCDWYWGFGYLATKTSHYHLNTLGHSHLKANIDAHFRDFIITNDKDRWLFAELVSNVYALRQAAELFGRGGSHLTCRSPVRDLLKDDEYVHHINATLIPKTIDCMYQLLAKYSDSP